jgi:hypothetical protein
VPIDGGISADSVVDLILLILYTYQLPQEALVQETVITPTCHEVLNCEWLLQQSGW